MAKYWVKQQHEMQERKSTQSDNQESPKPQEKTEEKGILGKLFRNTSMSRLHRFALLHHRALPSAAFAQKTTDKSNKTSPNSDINSNQQKNLSLKDMMCNPKAPLVVAISHSDRAARFHQSNGFEPVSRLPFYDAVENSYPFYTHVLVLDPFRTGRLHELTADLCAGNKPSLDKNQINDHLKSVNSNRILI